MQEGPSPAALKSSLKAEIDALEDKIGEEQCLKVSLRTVLVYAFFVCLLHF